ncbi:riboflavin kinase [Daldinia vernicosa]|uniref:riboflavin kinase n=1 Tax=Daldinia vernicosa TaxID=114800 RepID=UPI0020084521|nr:riboflavin kinase [Daldinia vernicosa]KAI0849705.1 riboflavin kinase [Daldinia vernicosa]
MAAEDRPRVLYADSGPEPPYPLRMEGTVISGFGRGSKELGIPTANLPVDSVATPWIASAKSGVYFGYAALALPSSHPDRQDTTDSQPQEPRHRSNPRAATNAPPHTTITSVSTSSETFPSFSSSASSSLATKEASQQKRWQIYPMVMSIGYNPFYKNSVRSAEVHVLREFGADFYDAPMRLLILGFVREERDYASLEALITDINIDCEVARQSLARPAWTPRQGTADGVTGEFDGSWLVRES